MGNSCANAGNEEENRGRPNQRPGGTSKVLAEAPAR